MKILDLGKIALKKAVTPVAEKIAPVYWKEFNELSFWKSRKKTEGKLSNDHYEYFYTTHFGLTHSDFQDKVILDIGCGPRGSLEWASMTSRRIGLDPLAKEYLQLGAKEHQMEYMDAPSEHIPLEDAECDAVFSFNSLDHVEDVEQTLSEIKRILRAGGLFLLIVEINHKPTACEPHRLDPQGLLDALKPEFECETLQVYKPMGNGVYDSIRDDQKLPDPQNTNELGYLSAKFIRTATR